MQKNEYLIGIDTETSNALIDENNKLDLSQSLVYDIGWQVIDTKGKVYKKRSYVVAEIFLDKELMQSAYFKDKIPQYWSDIKTERRELKTFKNIHRQFLADRKKFNATVVFAHNAFFDWKALNNTIRLITGSDRRYFFPKKVEMWDTLKMSRDVFGQEKSYTVFCDKYGYKTNHKHPQNRFTAEILYRYLTNNTAFEEKHTGLEDVEIETEILLYCLNSKREMRRLLFSRE